MYLGNLGCLVLPEQVAVTGQKIHEGKISDERLEAQVRAIGAGLAEWTAKP